MDNSFKDVLDRYGPMAALVAVLVLLVTILPSNAKGGAGGAGQETLSATGEAGGGLGTGDDPAGGVGAAGTGSTADGGTGGAAGGTGGTAAGGASTGGTVGGAGSGEGSVATGPGCRPDGRQAGVSRFQPPCAQYDGSNGGATHRGVTADTVKVAYFVPRASPATQAALKAAGAGDEQRDIDRVMEVYRRYFNNHVQTYGREVVLVKEEASGSPEDDVAMKADAKRLAEKGYFAALTAGGTTSSATFDATLNANGVICVYCTVSQANSFYERTAGFNFGAYPTLRSYYSNVAEYAGKRLVGQGRTARHAGAPRVGDVDLRKQPRKFGLIWLSAVQGTVNPGLREERDHFIKNLLPRYGITDVVDSEYNYDITQGPTTAQTIIARMNTSRVTTIIQIADPLMPVFFTREATKQQYFPEWFVTGTLLTDTTFFGRTYDQGQWSRAFGVSPLWVFWENLRVSDGYREYHHYCKVFLPPAECVEKKESVGVNTYRAGLLYLFNGISMAGPRLTQQSFAAGMYAYPATGGLPHAPLYKFTPDQPQSLKDFTEVWWDANRQGKDEVSTEGRGVLMKANGGKRYLLGQWPTSDPNVFDPTGAVFTSDAPYLSADSPKHEQDGHTHNPKKRCLSCP